MAPHVASFPLFVYAHRFTEIAVLAGIRQERPPHLRPEAMHPAMRERGRAIPQPGSIHGGDRPQSAPRIVEGRVSS